VDSVPTTQVFACIVAAYIFYVLLGFAKIIILAIGEFAMHILIYILSVTITPLYRGILGRLVVWWYVTTDTPKDNYYSAENLFFTNSGTPFVTVFIKGVKYNIDINPLWALQMRTRVGKESAIPGSDMIELTKIPKGIFHFTVGGQYAGCAFRLAVRGQIFLVTAKHVYDKFANNEIKLCFGNRSYKFIDKPISTGEISDFVLFKDNFVINQWGPALVGAQYLRNSKVRVKGSPDSNIWFESSGVSHPIARPFGFNHLASTQPGWSGAPVFNNDGKVVGIHTGSKIDRVTNEVVNEATAITDIITCLLRVTKTSVVFKESDFDYQSEVWSFSQLKNKMKGSDYIKFRDAEYMLGMGDEDTFFLEDWDDDEDDITPYDRVYYGGRTESADFHLSSQQSDCEQQQSSSDSETIDLNESKRTKCNGSRKVSFLTVDKETKLSPSVSLDPSTSSIKNSRKPAISTGHNDLRKVSLPHWATTEAFISLTAKPLIMEYLNERSIKLSTNLRKDLRGVLLGALRNTYPEILLKSASLSALLDLMDQSQK